MTTSADLGIVYIAGQQAQPEITHNTALNQLQILQTGVISVALNTPPGSPAQGDTYILGASPTGAWSGRANCLAGYFGTGWVFVPGADSSGTQIPMGVRHEGLKVYSKADNALYVWNGTAWAVVTSGMTNPMTTSQDLIVGGASGTPGRLAIGTNGFVLTAVAGAVAWAAATGFANPMTTSGDIIYGGASGVATRLAAGTNGHVLTLAAGVPSWAANAGMVNPMTTSGDVIYGGASGVPTRLAAGTNGHVLTLASGVPAWAANSAMANPMTTAGDLILGGASGVAGRLGIGSTGQILTVVGGTAAWATAAASMANPMTTAGDLIVGGASGTPARLGVGSTGQVLTVSGGTAAWATPAGGSQAGMASAAASTNDFPFYTGTGGYTTATLNSATRVHFNLVYLDSALTFTDIVIAVRTGSAATTVDVGIYNFLGAGKPGTCVASANLSTASAGRVAVTLGAPVTINPGLYYVATHGSVSPTLAVYSQASASVLGQIAGLAISDAMTQIAAGTTTLSAVLFNDSALPGGSYTRGMDLTGLNMTSANIVGYNTNVPIVALKKQ